LKFDLSDQAVVPVIKS